jgi:hypothetical protein
MQHTESMNASLGTAKAKYCERVFLMLSKYIVRCAVRWGPLSHRRPEALNLKAERRAHHQADEVLKLFGPATDNIWRYACARAGHPWPAATGGVWTSA